MKIIFKSYLYTHIYTKYNNDDKNGKEKIRIRLLAAFEMNTRLEARSIYNKKSNL